MDFVAVVDQVIALLRQRGRVAYRMLKRQFQLDDEALEDLKIELIGSQRLATDEQGTVLVWTSAGAVPPAAPAGLSGTLGARPPVAYTPPYLAEKILTSRTALEGERKLVTVLFADLKGSMELLADRDPEEARQLGWVSAHLAVLFSQMGDQEQALTSCQRTLALAETLGDVILQVRAMLQLGRVYYILGDYRQAIEYSRRGVTCLEGDMLRERFGLVFLPSVNTRVVLVECLAEVGAFAEGLAIGTQGLQIAEAVDHPVSHVIAYLSLGLLAFNKGDFPEAVRMLEQSLGLAQATEFLVWSPRIAVALGSAYARSGRVTDARLLLEQAVEQAATMQLKVDQTLRVLGLSEVSLLTDRLEEACSLAERALELAQAYKERGRQAYALCLLGDIAMQRDPPQSEQAAAHYHQALTLTEALGMRPLAAHCHRGLGLLYCQSGRVEQARLPYLPRSSYTAPWI